MSIDSLYACFDGIAQQGLDTIKIPYVGSWCQFLVPAPYADPLWRTHALLIRDRRMALSTTSRDDSDMPMPAIQGVTWPMAAAGMARAL